MGDNLYSFLFDDVSTFDSKNRDAIVICIKNSFVTLCYSRVVICRRVDYISRLIYVYVRYCLTYITLCLW